MRDWKTLRDGESVEPDVSTGMAPGKRTLTTGLRSSIQRRAAAQQEEGAAEPGLDDTATHEIAAEGTGGEAGQLPYLDQIQRSFGRHDVTDVEAHTGEPAARATQALGAEAYAFGNKVAFGGTPSLHTAAHEAAHVVQQRAGRVSAAVGQDGDEHERHADAVADRVVAGESAEPLLDAMVGDPGGASDAVQGKRLGTSLGNALAARYVQRHGAPRRAVQRSSAGGVSLSNMTFSPREIKDDGATTSQASVRYSNSKMSGAAKINWAIDGNAFGASVDDNGLITPGTDTVPIDKEKVVIKVKAVDSVQAGAHTTGKLTILNQKVLQAKKDFATFTGTTYKQLNYKKGLNGNFDAVYNPSRKNLGIEVRVKFNFVDDLAGATKWKAASKKAFISKFMSQVRGAWSGQYQFANIAEPKLVWKKLNPINVSVNAKEDNGAPHFTATVHKKDVTDNVLSPNADFSAASATPNNNPFPGTGAAELAALQAKIPTPTLFPAGSSAIGADLPKLKFVGTYLHAVRQPKFRLTITGHAAPDPAAVTPAQKTKAARAARTLSRDRANAVKTAIRDAGNNHHAISVVAKGDTAGVAAPAGDKVEIAAAVDPSYVNTQPVLAHEFGHMLGLGDEYPGGTRVVGGKATHYDLAKDALGQDVADSFARITTDSEGIMQGGRDVRPVHYVTLWSALVDGASTAAAPVPAFTSADWKFVGM